MTLDDRQAPPGVDPAIPNGARIYDAMLGGKDNFAADRAAVEKMLQVNPHAPRTAHDNRGFLGRAVTYLAGECGVRQFLDIGTGLPTRQNVHEVAQESVPDARVVYVDYDPLVVLHGQALLAGADTVSVIEGDLRSPESILRHAEVNRLIDFDRPVGVLLVAIVHFLAAADDPAAAIGVLRDALAPGSHLVLSHTADESADEVMDSARSGFTMAGAPLTPRTRAEVAELFAGFELVDPGVIDVRRWRPLAPELIEQTPKLPWTIVGGVGRLG